MKLWAAAFVVLREIWQRLKDPATEELAKQAVGVLAYLVGKLLERGAEASRRGATGVYRHFVVREWVDDSQSFLRLGRFEIKTVEKDLAYIAVFFVHPPSGSAWRVCERAGGAIVPMAFAETPRAAAERRRLLRDRIARVEGVRVLRPHEYPNGAIIIDPPRLRAKRIVAWTTILFSLISIWRLFP